MIPHHIWTLAQALMEETGATEEEAIAMAQRAFSALEREGYSLARATDEQRRAKADWIERRDRVRANSNERGSRRKSK